MPILKITHVVIGILLLLTEVRANDESFCLAGTVRVFTNPSLTEVNVCSPPGVPDFVSFRHSVVAMPTGFVMVNSSNTIVYVSLNGNINFDLYPAGTYRVYGFSYLGAMTGQVGRPLATTALGSVCFRLSNNFITVYNQAADAGTISSSAGTGPVVFCVGDGQPNMLGVSTTSQSNAYAWLVTNEDNIILAVHPVGFIDFENLPAGIVRVWGISYGGNSLPLSVGDQVNPSSNQGNCYDLSDNFIEVNNFYPDAGQIYLEGGVVSFADCNADESGGLLTALRINALPIDYVFLLTTPEGQIVQILADSVLNFNALEVGAYRLWGVSYTGSLTVEPGDFITQPLLSTECNDRSDNFIQIEKYAFDAGSITLSGGGTSTSVCTFDGQPDLLSFESIYNGSENLVYLITDAAGTLVAVSESGDIDFENAEGSELRVWTAVYTGDLLLEAGSFVPTAAISNDCYALSESFVTVSLQPTYAGFVSGSSINICRGTTAETIQFTAEAAQSVSYHWLVVDAEGIIRSVEASANIDFSLLPLGVYSVYGLAYTGTLTVQAGQAVDAAVFASQCFDLSDNHAQVTISRIDGGTVVFDNGALQAISCQDEILPDVFNFQHTSSAAGSSYVYLLTDNNNNILEVLTAGSVDLTFRPSGIFRIWGLSYAGTLTAATGANAATTALSSACFQLSSNHLTIVRSEVDGGLVRLSGGGTQISLCTAPGNDVLQFDSTGFSSSNGYIYLVTDINNRLQHVVTGDAFDFRITAAGSFRVWGLAYSGVLLLQTGAVITNTILSSQCYELSDNFVTVFREAPSVLSLATLEGDTELAFCSGDSEPDYYRFRTFGSTNANIAYILTDENDIIRSVLTVDQIDFDTMPSQLYYVWALTYTGTLTANVGGNIYASGLSSDCFVLSGNNIVVFAGDYSGGQITLFGGNVLAYACPGDGDPDIVSFFHDFTIGNGNYVYILTNEENVIQYVQEENSFDFDGLPEGVTRVWGLLYNGELLATEGLDLDFHLLASSCYGLSEQYATVYRYLPAADNITTESGATSVNVCSGDGQADQYNFQVSGASFAALTFLVVEDGFLVGAVDDANFNFEGSGEGNWQVYGLSYTGSLQVLPGDNIFEVPLASGCWKLTDNFVQLNKDRIDGGIVLDATNLSTSDIYVCIQDGQQDVFSFANTGISAFANYTYVRTSGNNIILSSNPTGIFNFETMGLNTMRIRGLSYTGNANVPAGSNLLTTVLSDRCYDLSENVISVYRGVTNGGVISFPGGSNPYTLCAINGQTTVQVATSSGSNLGYVYVLLNSSNAVVKIFPGSVIDMASVSEGTYTIYGLSYAGTLLLEQGDIIDFTTNEPSTSCFDWSDNSLTLQRSRNLDGGMLETQLGALEFYVCPDPVGGNPLLISTTSNDTPYKLILTNDSGQVRIPDLGSNAIDMADLPVGIYRIYGISYAGSYTVTVNASISQSILSTGCWALSQNYVRIVVQSPAGGLVNTAQGDETISVIVGDGESDAVTFVNNSTSLAQYAYLVTDEFNNLLFHTNSNVIDFEPTGLGSCRVWGLSYTGNLTLTPGQNAAFSSLSDDCFDLSDNFITLVRIPGLQPDPTTELAANMPPMVAAESVAIGGTASNEQPLSLWPNPVQQQLWLKGDTTAAATELSQVLIFDLAGKRVAEARFTQAQLAAGVEMAVGQLRPGLYLLRWQQGYQMTTLRFVKQ
jgi:hypothetical protein